MAKGRSNVRGNAHGSPSSLTSLLALPKPTPVTAAIADMERLYAEHQSFFDPNRVVGLRGYVPEWDDRREYHPAKQNRPAGSLIRSATRLIISPPRITGRSIARSAGLPTSIPSAIGFRIPQWVSICVRRKTRKEVMHAKNYVKKGAGAKRRRNQWSKIKC